MNASTLLVALIPLAIALAALALPLLGRRAVDGAADSTVAILKDQLAELERDRQRGLIGEQAAAAARLEVERRILKEAGRTRPRSFEASGLGRALLVLAILAVPLGSAALYLRLGAPGMPDRPLASREQERTPGPAPEEVLRMVAGLEARLEAKPGDVQGWLMLGRSRLVLRMPDEAIAAYRRALDLAPEAPEAVTGLAEALLERAMGVVTPEVRQLMFRLAELAPDDPRPLFYMGLADAQAGDHHGALERWRVLLERSPADAPWRAQVEPSIRQAAAQLGLDPEPILALAAPPTPQEQRVRELAALEPEARRAEIDRMVQALADRLATEGGGPADWQRLGRARLVLGEREAAAEAFRQGLAEAPDDVALAKDLVTALVEAPADPEALPAIPDEALAHLEQALAQAPDDPELHWYLGIRALADGQPDQARTHWQQVLARLDPTAPEHALVRSRLDRLPVN